MSYRSYPAGDPLADFDRLPDAAHVRKPVVAALFGCSSESIRRKVLAGIIPEPKKFGTATVWNVGDLRCALKLTVEA